MEHETISSKNVSYATNQGAVKYLSAAAFLILHFFIIKYVTPLSICVIGFKNIRNVLSRHTTFREMLLGNALQWMRTIEHKLAAFPANKKQEGDYRWFKDQQDNVSKKLESIGIIEQLKLKKKIELA